MSNDSREQLIPGENLAWYQTGPTEMDFEYLCAYHALGCPPLSEREASAMEPPKDCEECEQHRKDCGNGCPSTHKDACERYFDSYGWYGEEIVKVFKCDCKCHDKWAEQK